MQVIDTVKIMSETDLHSFFRGIMSPITKGRMAVFSVELRNVNHERKQIEFALNHVKISLRLNVFREFLEEKSRKMFLDGIARNTAIRQEISLSVRKN